MEDGRIIELYRRRDAAAIGASQEKYTAFLRGVAFNILRSSEDAEECVNDTWLKAWQAIPPAEPVSLKMFLAKITRNLALDRLREAGAKKRSGETMLLLEELSECVSPEGDPVSLAELRDTMRRFVSSLPQREGNVFIRRYFFAESFEEIAARYRLTAGNVKVILSRARRKLKTCLKKEGYIL